MRKFSKLGKRKIIAERKVFKWILAIFGKGEPEMLWECPAGHRWSASLRSLNSNQDCPDCHKKLQ